MTGTASAWTDAGALGRGSRRCSSWPLPAGSCRPGCAQPLDPLLGPPRAVPVVAGLVAGVGGGRAVLVARPGRPGGDRLRRRPARDRPPAMLTGWRRGLFVPVAVAAGIVMSGLVPGAARDRRALGGARACCCCSPRCRRCPSWSAGPTSGRWRCRRWSAASPAAVLLALPDRHPDAGRRRRALLTVLYAVAMPVGSALDAGSRTATARAAALAAAARGAAPAPRTATARCSPPFSPSRARSRSAGPGGPADAASTRLAAWRGGAAGGGRVGRSPPPRDLATSSGTRCSAAAGLLIAAGPPARGTAPRGRPGDRRCWWPRCRRLRWR